MTITKTLRQPFALEQSFRFKMLTVIVAGVFIASLLIIAEPFNINKGHFPLKILVLSGYGVVTSIVSAALYIIAPIIFPTVFDEQRWTIGKHIVHMAGIATTIAVCNYFYTVSFYKNAIPGVTLFLYFLGATYTLGLPVIITVTVAIDRQLLKQRVSEANITTKYLQEISSGEHRILTARKNNVSTLSLRGVGAKESLELDLPQLLAIKANGNYAVVYYNEQEVVKKLLLRCTLKQIEFQTQEFPQIVRCHKSYIANMVCVERVSGTAQGYQFHIPSLEFSVPVSRSFYRMALNNLQAYLA
jgi:LytTr DNA-binding domain